MELDCQRNPGPCDTPRKVSVRPPSPAKLIDLRRRTAVSVCSGLLVIAMFKPRKERSLFPKRYGVGQDATLNTALQLQRPLFLCHGGITCT